jgi:hypothetical protein
MMKLGLRIRRLGFGKELNKKNLYKENKFHIFSVIVLKI